MLHRFAFLLLGTMFLLPLRAPAQQVKGPYKVSDDSIGITLTQVKLKVAGTDLEFSSDSPTPFLRPTGSRKAKVWFSIGFMLESCRVSAFERMSPPYSKNAQGATINRLTFRCHYKASEFQTAVSDLIK